MTVIHRAPTTESAVQDAIARHFTSLRYDMIVPNCGSVFGWESDVLAVNAKGLVHEVEIKVSRADWLVEMRAASAEGPALCPQKSPMKWNRHQCLRGDENASRSGHIKRPAYFWVAAPSGVVLDGELPDYCGLLLYGVTGCVDIKIKAPRLHREPITDKQWRAMARGLSLRYWKGRRSA